MPKRQSSYRIGVGPVEEKRKFFQGEMMVCAVCGRQQKSDPTVESNWTIIENGEELHYICPRELPLDPKATRADFTRAYERIFRKLGIK